MVDALKSLMSTMADAITHQVSEQVKRAMEAASSARPPLTFEYSLVYEGEPSHRSGGISSPRPTERGPEVSRSDRSGRLPTGQLRQCAAMEPTGCPAQGTTTGSATALPPTQHTSEVRGHPMLRRPSPMTAPPRPQNARKYCEFHEQSGHATTKCRELKKALHELADKGQIDRFLKRGPRFLRQEEEPAPPPPRDEECSTEVVATVGGLRGRNNSANLKSSTQKRTEVNPTGIIHLPVCFGDKIKSRNLEVDFLIVDVPTAYNQGPARPCGGTRGCRSGLAGSPASGLGPRQPRPSPANAVALSSRSHGPPGPPAVFRSDVGTARRAPPAAGTPQQSSPLERRPQPWLFLPR
ncbi:hypothetical protein Cgig2_015913 [Carnegiea gigantea]|uniref:Reverse transcriptase domain-containing protein n=1 Tax=Carnegiea gigantea TaxID=171969 RepID=A0A9Q1GRX5_9CARY|nr:hypothetical protein Cgig2_015913 [Carnegiea gigantea]